MTKIRNIVQTNMERDIIKTAPDMVVYLNDLPFVYNPYIGEDPVLGQAVNFNDYITDISGNVDSDALIPSCSITMSVPNHYNYLFMAPGGNKILSTMSTVKIFCKGYYFDDEGNSVYHRIFYGVVDSVAYAYTGTSTQISINCKGIMRLFELIQTNVNPAALNFGVLRGQQVTPFLTKDYNKSALIVIYNNIFNDLDATALVSALGQYTIQKASSTNALDTNISTDSLIQNVQDRFISRWQPVLNQIKAATRIFGVDYLTANSKNLNTNDQKEIASFFEKQKTAINKYLPEYAIGNIQLLQSQIVSKLERMTTMANVVGYEAYQDVNGNIIFKPPLYNLDVTNSSLPEDKNPFIVSLHEIQDESEQEDEAAIRATRLTVKGHPWGALLSDTPDEITPGIATYTDINLFSKFGMREEPTKLIAWLGDNEKVNYAFAIMEMARMNRSYRTYRFTIPIRPEMKVAFPCYIKHHDMYGYIRNISWSYTVGGTSNMSVTMDSIRRRVLIPYDVKRKDDAGNPIQTKEYQSVPNLVYAYVKSLGKNSIKKQTNTSVADPSGTKGAIAVDDPVDNGYARSIERNDDYLQSVMIQTQAPKKGDLWAISRDSGNFFTSPRPCDETYLKKLVDVQPYTDSKGYELYGPIPCGRWIKLEDAITEFTMTPDEVAAQEGSLKTQDQSIASSMISLATANVDLKKVTNALIPRQLTSGFNVTSFTVKSTEDVSDAHENGEANRQPDHNYGDPYVTPVGDRPGTKPNVQDSVRNTFVSPKTS